MHITHRYRDPAREWIGFSLPSERNPICKIRHNRKNAQLLPPPILAVPRQAVGIVAVDKKGAVDAEETGAERVFPLADAGFIAILLTAGVFWTVCEFMAIGYAVQMNEDADPYIVWCAVPIALIPAAYGLLVYFISLIIRLVSKPKM